MIKLVVFGGSPLSRKKVLPGYAQPLGMSAHNMSSANACGSVLPIPAADQKYLVWERSAVLDRRRSPTRYRSP